MCFYKERKGKNKSPEKLCEGLEPEQRAEWNAKAWTRHRLRSNKGKMLKYLMRVMRNKEPIERKQNNQWWSTKIANMYDLPLLNYPSASEALPMLQIIDFSNSCVLGSLSAKKQSAMLIWQSYM